MGKTSHNGECAELFVGLVGAVGTNLGELVGILRRALSRFGYECEEIRLSQFLTDFTQQSSSQDKPSEYARIDALMTQGDELRRKLRFPDALALLSCGKIKDSRERGTHKRGSIGRRCYVLNSLKRKEEVQRLRRIYGSAFYVVAAYCPRDVRQKKLAAWIAEDTPGSKPEDHNEKAERLISRDEAEEDYEFGQDLRGTFPLADVFVNASGPDQLKTEMERFIRLVFGHPFETPTRDEYGMFLATAAALRSSDLSRQVGAAIASRDGQIVSVGTNEVPKAGGGLYWTGDSNDSRDFKTRVNSNKRFREDIVSEIVLKLKKAGWLSDPLCRQSPRDLIAKAVSVLEHTRVMDIGEFGRTIHAEMAALVDAARRGVSVQAGTLYSTTFPCHMCAKHIVAAGISRVVYINPYPKSLAQELHDDSVAVDSTPVGDSKVNFQPFIGIAPRRYVEVFTAPQRKGPDGEPAAELASDVGPRYPVLYRSYADTEKEAFQIVIDALKSAGLLSL
ncbi:MAG: hypothetical protein JXB46_00545 [Candidatus Eisenbacteria bacterium]|nr:hypothetical protein [Candidatus Eisenbacteria bacterium]